MKFIYAIIAVAIPWNGVISQVVFWEENGHYYEVVSAKVDWTTAANLAAESRYMGIPGHLVTLTSYAENLWVWNTFNQPDFHWLGGTDQVAEGHWNWVTGERWSYASWDNMGGQQPDNYGPGEDYLEYHYAGHGAVWNDYPDSGQRSLGYIIEYEGAAVPEPSLYSVFFGSIAFMFVYWMKSNKRRTAQYALPE